LDLANLWPVELNETKPCLASQRYPYYIIPSQISGETSKLVSLIRHPPMDLSIFVDGDIPKATIPVSVITSRFNYFYFKLLLASR
jgi:hypothetical protein